MESGAKRKNRGLVFAVIIAAFFGSVICNHVVVNRVFADGEGDLSSSSHISNRTSSTAIEGMNDWNTTGPSNSGSRADTKVMVVCGGDSAAITFSHNIYSHGSVENVPWTVTRSGFGDSGYTVDVGTDLDGNQVSGDYSAMSVDGTTSGYVNIGTAYNNDAYNGLIADESSRPYLDADTGSRYVHRDYYNITFDKSSEGNIYNFCETMSVGGGGVTSQACTEVKVEKCGGDGGNDDCSGIAGGNTTTVSSHVKNSSIGTGWAKTVYAKPGDSIDWRHCYYSGVQSLANKLASSDAHKEHSSSLSAGHYPQNNQELSRFGKWENKYDIFSDAGNNKSQSFAIGSVVTDTTNNNYGITDGDVGATINEKIMSGYPVWATVSETQECGPWECDSYDCDEPDGDGICWRECDHLNTCWISSSRGGNASDNADVKVPYNYLHRSSVALAKDIVFAGETATVSSFNVTIEPRYNSITQGTYATNDGGTKTALIGYASNTTSGGAFETGDSNICYSVPVYGGKCAVYSESSNPTGVYNVYDVPAGKYFCVVAAVYPASSGGDTNMSPTGSGTWWVSAPACAKIAKKPSIQIWGAGM
ncbi:hypothetical protein J6V85_00675, partial [Candidatus Saccharibacteria bacterium]|nr:hypothetical protein [Candidatus Saccharibacteria bacterium]